MVGAPFLAERYLLVMPADPVPGSHRRLVGLRRCMSTSLLLYRHQLL